MDFTEALREGLKGKRTECGLVYYMCIVGGKITFIRKDNEELTNNQSLAYHDINANWEIFKEKWNLKDNEELMDNNFYRKGYWKKESIKTFIQKVKQDFKNRYIEGEQTHWSDYCDDIDKRAGKL